MALSITITLTRETCGLTQRRRMPQPLSTSCQKTLILFKCEPQGQPSGPEAAYICRRHARPTRWVRAGVQPVGSGPQAIGTAPAIGTPPGLELSAVFPNLSRASETPAKAGGIPKSTLYDYVKGRAACFKLMESPLLYNI